MSSVQATLLVVAGIMLHFLVSLAGANALLSAAYAYDDIDSIDELYWLGPAPQVGAIALMLIGLIEAVVSLAVLAYPPTRTRAWICPLLGIAASIVVVVATVSLYQEPTPLLGG